MGQRALSQVVEWIGVERLGSPRRDPGLGAKRVVVGLGTARRIRPGRRQYDLQAFLCRRLVDRLAVDGRRPVDFPSCSDLARCGHYRRLRNRDRQSGLASQPGLISVSATRVVVPPRPRCSPLPRGRFPGVRGSAPTRPPSPRQSRRARHRRPTPPGPATPPPLAPPPPPPPPLAYLY